MPKLIRYLLLSYTCLPTARKLGRRLLLSRVLIEDSKKQSDRWRQENGL